MNLHDQYIIGDCLEILPTIPDESFDLILTDPPYGINYQSHRAKSKSDYTALRFPKIQNDDNILWFKPFFCEACRTLKMNRHMYLFCNWTSYPAFHQIITDTLSNHPYKDVSLKGLIVWDKLSHGTGDRITGLLPQHEWIMFLSKGRREFNQIGHRISRVDLIRHARVVRTTQIHPAQKPTGLLRRLIEQSTLPDELVCDPFAGSFATARACKSRISTTGSLETRDYFCIEIDPQWEKCIKNEPGLTFPHFMEGTQRRQFESE